MNDLFQFCVILGFSFLGELLHAVLPFSLPASIYGLILLFAALYFKLIRPEKIRRAGTFLASILSVLFVSPVVNLLGCADQVKNVLIPVAAIVILSTVVTFGASGKTVEILMKRRKERTKDE